jgi:hypothetical protein
MASAMTSHTARHNAIDFYLPSALPIGLKTVILQYLGEMAA